MNTLKISRKKLGENQINYPVIDVRRDYDKDIPVVEVRAEDHIEGTVYKDRYRLEEITKEEFEKVMFEIWKETIEDLEQY